jgi:hypothetical protein
MQAHGGLVLYGGVGGLRGALPRRPPRLWPAGLAEMVRKPCFFPLFPSCFYKPATLSRVCAHLSYTLSVSPQRTLFLLHAILFRPRASLSVSRVSLSPSLVFGSCRWGESLALLAKYRAGTADPRYIPAVTCYALAANVLLNSLNLFWAYKVCNVAQVFYLVQ